MGPYNVKVSYSKQVIQFIVFAALSVLPILLLGTMYASLMPVWALVLCLCVLAAILIMLAIYLPARLSAPAVVILNDDGFNIDFLKKGYLHPASFQLSNAQLKNWETNGNDTDGYYLSFTTTVRPRSFNIDARTAGEADVSAFLELIRAIPQVLSASAK